MIMQKIIEYKVAYSDAVSCFEEEVNVLLKEGWVPYGNLAFQFCPNEIRRFNYCQVMVKYEEVC